MTYNLLISSLMAGQLLQDHVPHYLLSVLLGSLYNVQTFHDWDQMLKRFWLCCGVHLSVTICAWLYIESAHGLSSR